MPQAVLLILLALALLLAAYLAYALRDARRALSRRPDFDSLIVGVHEFANRELEGANVESRLAGELIHEAVLKLHAGLGTLAEESRVQSVRISGLVEGESSGSPGAQQFAAATSGLIASLAQTLDETSHESVKTVQTIDQMTRHLEGIFELIGDLDGMAQQTARLATGAMSQATEGDGDPRQSLELVADEVRLLADRAIDFNARIRALVGRAQEALVSSRQRVESTADQNMNAAIEARSRADVLIQNAVEVNRTLAAGVRDATDSNHRLREGVGTVAQALKFEAAAGRALAAIEAHLGRLAAMNAEATRLRETLNDPSQSSLMRDRALERFGRQLRRI